MNILLFHSQVHFIGASLLASGSSAIDVSLTKICWCGGWSIQSKAVHDYVDPTCPATPACWLFFGWLRTLAPPPAEAAAFG